MSPRLAAGTAQLELTAFEVKFLGGRDDMVGGPGGAEQGYGGDFDESEEELPF